MNKSLLATVLAADVVLALFAIVICNWIGSDFRFALDSPADKIIWMMVVGVVAAVVAVILLRRESKNPDQENHGPTSNHTSLHVH